MSEVVGGPTVLIFIVNDEDLEENGGEYQIADGPSKPIFLIIEG